MFDVFSIVFLILMIIFVIIGIFKGFLSLALGLAKGLIATLLASLLCNPVGGLLAKTGIGTGITGSINNFLVEKSDYFEMTISTEVEKQEFLDKGVGDALNKAGFPDIIKEPVANIISEKVNIPLNEKPIGIVIGEAIARYVCVIIAFIVLILVFSIVLWIVQRLFKNANKIPVFGTVNRVLGGIFGLGLALFIIGIVCYVVAIIISLPGEFPQSIAQTFKLAEGQENEWSIAKFCYKYNIIGWIIKLIF